MLELALHGIDHTVHADTAAEVLKRLKTVLADGHGQAVDGIAVGERLLHDGDATIPIQHARSPRQAGTRKITLLVEPLQVKAQLVRAGRKGGALDHG
ncbi:hypothetical protein FQZ97_1084260 [compost metagenome]